MRIHYTNRGFQHLWPTDAAGHGGTTPLVTQASTIGDYPDAASRPGSSYLWIANFRLNREEVAELAERLKKWTETGSLSLLDEYAPTPSLVRQAQDAALLLGPVATDKIVGSGGLSGATQEQLLQLIEATWSPDLTDGDYAVWEVGGSNGMVTIPVKVVQAVIPFVDAYCVVQFEGKVERTGPLPKCWLRRLSREPDEL